MIPYTYRPRKCKHCRESFMPERAGQIVHVSCISEYIQAVSAKKLAKQKAEGRAAAKVERAQIKRRKEALQTIPELIALTQKDFNAYIRTRDAGKACICCGKPLGEGAIGGAFDCGHYRSTGSASHLRFDERNAHAQRKVCNRWGAGRAVDYRMGLIKRIGVEAVEALESDNAPHKWTREELIEIRAKYKAKRKELEKERA